MKGLVSSALFTLIGSTMGPLAPCLYASIPRGVETPLSLVSPTPLCAHLLDGGPLLGSEGPFEESADEEMAPIRLASELTDRELRLAWEDYITAEGLGMFPNLLPLFDDTMKRLLLDDSTLFPVFMQVLSPEDLSGPLIIPDYSQEIMGRDFGGRSLRQIVEEHRVFKMGSWWRVDEDLNMKKGTQVLVGVVDRSSLQSFAGKCRVANGRQACFPLADGTFLGVKGSGQFHNNGKNQATFYWDPVSAHFSGLVNQAEINQARIGYGFMRKSGGSFVPFLAAQEMLSVPDGLGGSRPLPQNRRSYLAFNRMLTPHRLIKLPQLLLQDPGLRKFRKRHAPTLRALGILPQGKDLSLSYLVDRILTSIATNEALKWNHRKFKLTTHWQDITLFGEEADNEEWVNLPTLIDFLKIRRRQSQKEVEDFISSKTGSNILLTMGNLTLLMRPNSPISVSIEDKVLMVPDFLRTFEKFYKTYFYALDFDLLLQFINFYERNFLPGQKLTRTEWETLFYRGSWTKEEVSLLRQTRTKSILEWAGEVREERMRSDGAGT